MASLSELRDERIKKLKILQNQGLNPYPLETKATLSLAEVVSGFASLAKQKKPLVVAGRVLGFRGQGAIIFFDLFDGDGRLQAMVKKGEITDADRELLQATVDIGDIVEITGRLFITKSGEKTIQAKSWRMLAKSLRPLPEKWHGLQDVEERFRRRYLDTLMNEEVRRRFISRSRLIQEIRAFLDQAGFLEVETPILQPLPGGASAKPFQTHHHALDIDLYLRIAPELYLKELLVGGFLKVYELGRLFRNEGIDVVHNPEFTTVEFYEAFASASDHRRFLETMIRKISSRVTGKTEITFGENTINFKKPFTVISYFDLLKRYALITHPETITAKEAFLKATQLGVTVAANEPRHKILDGIYKKTCQPKLIQPTFVVDYPVAFSPLAKRKEENTALIDRFQLVVGGLELTNSFSELNDPLDQRERFKEQEKNKNSGDLEAQSLDEEYVEALEYGLPPCAGTGLSIDRLTMLLTNTKNIREVILFPTLRPKEK